MDLARQVIAKNKFKLARVCRVLLVSRSNQYESKKSRPTRYKRKDDSMVLKSILEVTKDRGTYGYPRVAASRTSDHDEIQHSLLLRYFRNKMLERRESFYRF